VSLDVPLLFGQDSDFPMLDSKLGFDIALVLEFSLWYPHEEFA